MSWRHVAHALVLCLAISATRPGVAFAQRALHWDALEVAAHLEANGRLRVTETHTMVFTGDWNGGERTFDIRPHQRLSFEAIYRGDAGGWRRLSPDSSLDNVDDYGWANGHTLRWRSRLPSDPPFANTTLRYQIHYALSNILLKEDDRYRLDHDFAFPNRPGNIERFGLRLTFDQSWHPGSDVRELYTAGPLPSGKGFVLDVPLLHTGETAPAAFDVTRPSHIVWSVAIILAAMLAGVVWFFVREQRLGRFAPLRRDVDEAWLNEHVLRYPAEVVAAAWDEEIGPAEVVALLARLEREGALESTVGAATGRDASMTLRLKVDRTTLRAHERTLIDKLFFGDRTETSTALVKRHYRKQGFDPAKEIRPELEAAVNQVLPASPDPPRLRMTSLPLFGAGAAIVVLKWFQGYPVPFGLIAALLALAVIGGIAGWKFRAYLHWGYRAALFSLIPALTIALGASAYLWFHARSGAIELHPWTVAGMTAMILSCALSSINALKSKRHADALAFRKALTAGRAFFIEELHQDRPALRDDWYPWLLAFDLGKHVDAWTSGRDHASRTTSHTRPGSSSSSGNSSSWTGFSGGRSGGAGSSASWQMAASGMAAGVAPPSSSSGSGSGGGSSSGGSSGGGGGGGW